MSFTAKRVLYRKTSFFSPFHTGSCGTLVPSLSLAVFGESHGDGMGGGGGRYFCTFKPKEEVVTEAKRDLCKALFTLKSRCKGDKKTPLILLFPSCFAIHIEPTNLVLSPKLSRSTQLFVIRGVWRLPHQRRHLGCHVQYASKIPHMSLLLEQQGQVNRVFGAVSTHLHQCACACSSISLKFSLIPH